VAPGRPAQRWNLVSFKRLVVMRGPVTHLTSTNFPNLGGVIQMADIYSFFGAPKARRGAL
jgi:hypothetical protein